jgi:hypothetical protein
VFLLVMVAIALAAADPVRGKWLVTVGAVTYPLCLMHYVAGTTVINRLRDAMDARVLVVVVIGGFVCSVGWSIGWWSGRWRGC